MPGPPPKPTALKILEGNRGKRPLNKAEPQPTRKPPTCPAWLDPEAKREWKRIAPELGRLGVLTVVDGAALAAYCQSWARFLQAERAITEHGMVEVISALDREGNAVTLKIAPRPEVAISQRERALMKTYLTGFGLDPASRSKVSGAPAGRDADPMAALLD